MTVTKENDAMREESKKLEEAGAAQGGRWPSGVAPAGGVMTTVRGSAGA